MGICEYLCLCVCVCVSLCVRTHAHMPQEPCAFLVPKRLEDDTRLLGNGVTVDLSHLIWMLGTKPRTQNKNIPSQSTPATVTHSPMMSHTLSQAQSKKVQSILFSWIAGFTCLYKSNSKEQRENQYAPTQVVDSPES